MFFTRRVLDVDTAFDLLSETFATALKCRRQFRGRSREQEQGWLFSIARSELSHYWRDDRVERSALERIGLPVPGQSDPEIERVEELAAVAELAGEVVAALDALPDEQRRAVELRIVEEHAYAEVAQQLGVSEHGPRPRLARAACALADPGIERGPTTSCGLRCPTRSCSAAASAASPPR